MPELDDRFAGAFDDMALERHAGNTVLTGPVRDQAELQGLLQRVARLRLPLGANALENSDRTTRAASTPSHTPPPRSSNDAGS
jgi:hypothetical protein